MLVSPVGRIAVPRRVPVAGVGVSAALVLWLAAGAAAQTGASPASSQPATGAAPATSTESSAPSTSTGKSSTSSKNAAPTRAPSKPGTFTNAGDAPAAASSAAPAAAGKPAVPPAEIPALPPNTPLMRGGSLEPPPGAVPVPPGAAGSGGAFPEDVPVYEQAAAGEPGEPGNSQVSVSEYMTVDMFVQDESLANVLQMLSLQSRKNIVAARDVDAQVTANLYGVTFYEALDSILHVNGYGYVEKGSFIYVYTLEEIEQIRADERRMVSKVIRLNYLNANDAAEFVSPLLSDKGKIKTNGDVGSFSIPADTPTGDEQFALSATLVVFDYPEHIQEIETLLDQLDTKPAQVLVEATILQTTLTENNAFGVDFAFLNGVNFTDFFDLGGALGAVNVLNEGDEFLPADGRATAVNSTPGNTAGPGTLKLGILHDDIALFIRALDEVSDVNIVSNPKVLALNRQAAQVSIGRKIGYLKSTTNNGVTEQDVEFLPTGTSLSFRPFVSKDGLIRLELKPKVSEGIINQFTDNEGRTVTVPDEVSQEVTTNVVVPDGATVVLGGLFRESTRLTRSQVPLLGDIPLLGAAFRGQEDKTDRSEIIFMIKPTIINDKVLLTQGEDAVQYADRVRVGSRQGLLPWSRDRQTAQLNVRAERLAAEGKPKEAAGLLRRSLELNPSQPDVYRMQQEMGESTPQWPTRSILSRIVDSATGDKAGALGVPASVPASFQEQEAPAADNASPQATNAPEAGAQPTSEPTASNTSAQPQHQPSVADTNKTGKPRFSVKGREGGVRLSGYSESR
jgi:type IV pilus assembly protein PilQ